MNAGNKELRWSLGELIVLEKGKKKITWGIRFWSIVKSWTSNIPRRLFQMYSLSDMFLLGSDSEAYSWHSEVQCIELFCRMTWSCLSMSEGLLLLRFKCCAPRDCQAPGQNDTGWSWKNGLEWSQRPI